MKQKLHSNVKRLMLTRGLRSLGQGMMIVDLTLYLKELDWSGASIGIVLTIASIFNSILILSVGVLSDRIGRKPFLLLAEGLTIISAGGACLTANPLYLSAAIIFAAFGRGQTGSAGPFAPAEQAWLARLIKREDRGEIYSFNTAIGFLGMGIGALIGGVPHLFQNILPGALSFRPVFLLIVILSLICFIIITRMPEDRHSLYEEENTEANNESEEKNNTTFNASENDKQQEKALRRKENWLMAKLSGVTMLNGLAVGLTGPLISYWFAIRFGASSALIGTTLGLSFLLTSVASVINGKLSRKFGLVNSVTIVRILGALLFIVLPFSPTFLIASIIYIVRNALNRGTQGARAALSTTITRDKRRGLSSSLNAVSMQVPSAAGPTVSGLMLDAGLFMQPFLIAAVLQLGYAVLYQRLFKAFNDKKQKTVKS